MDCTHDVQYLHGETIFLCDGAVTRRFERQRFYKRPNPCLVSYISLKLSCKATSFFSKFLQIPAQHGITRYQFRVSDTPIDLPKEVVKQAAYENWFIIVGSPVMPRRQNVRAIVASMPRNWGFKGMFAQNYIKETFSVCVSFGESDGYCDAKGPMGI